MHLDTEQTILQSRLNFFGSAAALDISVDLKKFDKQIHEFSDYWKRYNPRKPEVNRFGLSLTSLDGKMEGIPDLDSIYEYNKIHGTSYTERDFHNPTEAHERLTSLYPILSAYEAPLGRTHLLKLDKGGFFPPHRDAFGLASKCFRVLVPLISCQETEYAFLIDDRRLFMTPGRAYFIDTMRPHSIFSFVDNCILLVMNVPLTVENVKKTTELLWII